jgi:hypothetical protein
LQAAPYPTNDFEATRDESGSLTAPAHDDDKLNVQMLLKEALDDTLTQRAGVLDTDRQTLDNPAKGIPLFKQEGDGWEHWPDEVRVEFEALASKRAWLVYELCIGTGQRIGDVVKMWWAHFPMTGSISRMARPTSRFGSL